MRWSTVLLWFVAGLVACSPGQDTPSEDGSSAPEAPVVRQTSPEGSPLSADPLPEGPVVAFLGTSLTEGFGLADPESEGWPARVGMLAREGGIPLQVVNAGLSGETSAGALRRVEWVLRSRPHLLVVETGANDGLRGLPTAELEENLDALLGAVREQAPETRVVVVAMEAPPNMGSAYVEAFRALYPRVARRWNAHIVPFEAFLGPVAGDPRLNLPDGIHPTAEGHRLMAEGIWPYLEPLLTTGNAGAPETPSSRTRTP